MPGWGPWCAAQQMAFSQCSSIGRVPSTIRGVPSCHREHFWLQQKKKPWQFAVSKLPFSKREIYMVNWHFPMCSNSLPRFPELCSVYFTLLCYERCHAISEGPVLLWGGYELDVLITQGLLKLPVETSWSHQHNITADLGTKCRGCHSHFWWMPRQLTTGLLFMLMRLIPSVLFVRKAAQQSLGTRLLQSSCLLQTRGIDTSLGDRIRWWRDRGH